MKDRAATIDVQLSRYKLYNLIKEILIILKKNGDKGFLYIGPYGGKFCIVFVSATRTI